MPNLSDNACKEVGMRVLIVLFVFFTPLTFCSIYLSGHRVFLAMIPAMIVAIIVTFGITGGMLHLLRFTDKWLLPFAMFIIVGIISIIFSPYISVSAMKGVLQVAGILGMMGVSLAITRCVRDDPIFLLRIVRILVVILSIIAAIGVLQFLVVNLFLHGQGLDFSYLNNIAGGKVWKQPGYIGPIYRINSLIDEPSHFAGYLGLVAGLALIRLGILGKDRGSILSSVISYRSSMLILLAFLMSFSMLGYLLLSIILIATLFLSRRFSFKNFFRVFGVLVIIGISVFSLVTLTGPEFKTKFSTIHLIWSAQSEGVNSVEVEAISALAVAINTEVMRKNIVKSPLIGIGLGAHPDSFEKEAPSYINLDSVLKSLNKEDAASLLLRLLSETGVLGMFLFLLGCVIVVFRARCAILYTLEHSASGKRGTPSLMLTVAIGISASSIGIVIFYLVRMGRYYDPLFWLPLALTACIPHLLEVRICSSKICS